MRNRDRQSISRPRRGRTHRQGAAAGVDIPVTLQAVPTGGGRPDCLLTEPCLTETMPTKRTPTDNGTDNGTGDRRPDELDEAVEGLTREMPDPVCRAIRWVTAPESRWIRIPLGLLCIAASALWFLPVVGIEFLPLGLLLIAQDVPFLRRPVGRMTLKLEAIWRLFKLKRLKHRRT